MTDCWEIIRSLLGRSVAGDLASSAAVVGYWIKSSSMVGWGLVSLALHGVMILMPAHLFIVPAPSRAVSEIVLRIEAGPAVRPARPDPGAAEPPAQPETMVEPPSAAPHSPRPAPPPPRPKPAPPRAPAAVPKPKTARPPLSVAEAPALPRADLPAQGTPPPAEGPDEAVAPVEAVFGTHEGPRFEHRSRTRYPRTALRLGLEGNVVLRLTIDERGRLMEVAVLASAGAMLDDAAIQAVRSSTFHPARRNDHPVASRALLPVRFKLKE